MYAEIWNEGSLCNLKILVLVHFKNILIDIDIDNILILLRKKSCVK